MITRVLRNAAWLGIGEAGVKGGLFVAAVLVARGAGPSGVGTFSIAYSAALISILILAVGQQEVLIREVARSPERARLLVEGSESLQLRLGRWVVPAAAVGALLVGEAGLRFTLLAFLPYAVLRTATVTRGAAFKGIDRMDVEARARGLEIMLAVAILAVGALAAWPVWSTGIAFSLGAAAALVWIRRRQLASGEDEGVADPSELLREGLPFAALAVLSQSLANADRFLLAFLDVGRTEIGYWGVAGTVVWALVALPQLGAVAMYPSISRYAKQGGSPRWVGLAASLGGAAAGLVAAGAVRWLGDPLIRLAFGAAFVPAVPLLHRLALALPGAFAMMAVGAVFAAWRLQRRALWILCGVTLLSLGLNLLWIPRLGVLAPATVAPLTYTLAAVVMTIALLLAGPGKEGP
ncbi:MAG: oligosaccharide flippase family protein [Thermoanaerobaculales bacterium]